MATLELRGVGKRYGDTVAVGDISLRIGSGELVCLLGPSGSGKSTLLRLMGGFEAPTSGTLLIDGVDITRQPPERRPTAMVFQSHALWTHMSVAGNIGFGLRLRRLARRQIDEKVDAALALVGLDGFNARHPAQLSGGQQQRVALARCLVLEPKILLMDEPFASLDQHLRERLREEVRAIQRQLGITTVFVTHGQDEALAIADRIAVMSTGRINQVGEPAQIYAEPADSFVAGFIGAMNMIPGTIANGVLRAAAFEVPAPLPEGPAMLAIRPERLSIDAATRSGGCAARIARVVHFGAFQLVEATTDGADRIRVQVGSDRAIAAGEAVVLGVERYTVFAEGHAPFRSTELALPHA